MWVLAAMVSAFFSGVTSVLAKLGVRTADSDIAITLRTFVILIFTWAVAAAFGDLAAWGSLTPTAVFFLAASGICSGISWALFFKALSLGPLNKVGPLDKVSSVLTVLFSILILHEVNHIGIKLVCSAVILVGTYLMAEKDPDGEQVEGWAWLAYALAGVALAVPTSILAKFGIEDIPSNLATAIRTSFVFATNAAFLVARRKVSLIPKTDRRELGFIAASGISNSITWLTYYYAVSIGPVSVIEPINKLSLLVSMAFAATVLHEKFSRRSLIGLALLVVATLAMTVFA
jgi:transporter family protein